MRWPLYLTVNFILIAFIGVGFVGVVRRITGGEIEERQALSRGLDGLIATWDAAGLPPEARALNLFVGSETEGSFLDVPPSRSMWTSFASLFRREESRARGRRDAEAILGAGPNVADWYDEDMVWASERRARLRALGAYVARARAAHARIVVAASDREVGTLAAAVQAAEASTTDLVIVDKLIVLGADADNYIALTQQGGVEASAAARCREIFMVWREKQGNHFGFRDARGRVVTRALTGDAADGDDGAARLLRELASSSGDMASVLMRAGQIPPPSAAELAAERAAEEAARRAAAQAAARAAAASAPTAATNATAAEPTVRAAAPAPAGPIMPARSGRAAPGYMISRTPHFVFEAPAGQDWTATDYQFGSAGDRNFFEHRAFCLGRCWYDAVPSTQGWVQIEVTRIKPGLGLQDSGPGCEGVPLRSVKDLRDVLDCSVRQPCKPNGPDRNTLPLTPVYGYCGPLVGTTQAAGSTGYIYRERFDPEDAASPSSMSADASFNRALRIVDIVAAPPGAEAIYRVTYYAPEKEFDRYLPVFEHVAQTVRERAPDEF